MTLLADNTESMKSMSNIAIMSMGEHLPLKKTKTGLI